MENDSPVEVRCKRTSLAVLAKWYRAEFGYPSRSKSELIRAVIEELERLAIVAGIEPVETIAEAQSILEESIIMGAKFRGGKKNLLKNLKEENEKLSVSTSWNKDSITEEATRLLPMVEKEVGLQQSNFKRMPKEMIREAEEEDHSISSIKSNLATVPANLVASEE